MSFLDDFDLLLAEFNKQEEHVFLRNINEFAERHKDVVLRTFALLLKSRKLNIQLKYLILKSIGELKYPELVPDLEKLLQREDKVQIIYGAVNSLVRIDTLAAYKVIIHFLATRPKNEYHPQIEESLKDFYSKNNLVFHFDVFYRDKGDIKSIDRSSAYLKEHLPEEYIKDLLPRLSSKHYKIRYELLQLLKSRPNSLYYSTLYNYFKGVSGTVDEDFFQLLCETLVEHAALSPLCNKIFAALVNHLGDLEGNKKILLAISLLKLNTQDMVEVVTEFYPRLNYDRKMLVFENLKREEVSHYIGFIRKLLVEEDHEQLLTKVVEFLIYIKDYQFLFNLLRKERPLRRETILSIVIEFDPPGIESHIRTLIHASQGNNVLRMVLEYLMRHAADAYFPLVKKIFFSGAVTEIKTLIIRNLGKLSIPYRKEFLEMIFQDPLLQIIQPFKKDFLFALLGVLNDKGFERQFEDMVLNRILVMMEEASVEEVVNYIYFFEKYDVRSMRDMGLIIEELRLIQNTLLKTADGGDLSRLIHILIKNIEKRVKLKSEPPGKRDKGPTAAKQRKRR